MRLNKGWTLFSDGCLISRVLRCGLRPIELSSPQRFSSWRRRSIFGWLADIRALDPWLLPTAFALPPRTSPWPQNLFFGLAFLPAFLSALESTREWKSGRAVSPVLTPSNQWRRFPRTIRADDGICRCQPENK